MCFIEFSVNDLWPNAQNHGEVSIHDSYTDMEAIIRKIYASNPKSDIILVITGEFSSLKSDATSAEPYFAPKYTEIADYYKLPIIYVGRELVRTIYKENGNQYPESINNYVWKKYFRDNVHPYDLGYEHYANTIIKYLNLKLKSGYTATSGDYKNSYNPEVTLCEKRNSGELYLQADMIDNLKDLSNCTNKGFIQNGDYFISSRTGDSLSFDFESTNIGIWQTYGSKIDIEYSIDGKINKQITVHAKDGTNIMHILATNLSDGKHRLTINRIGGSGNLNLRIMLTGKAYVGKLTEYNKLPSAASPLFKLEGLNGGKKTMTITTDTSGGTIYYTLDGTNPIDSGSRKKYTAPITLTKNVEIKACTVKSWMKTSGVATFNYTTDMEGNSISVKKNGSYAIGGDEGTVFKTNSNLNMLTSVSIYGKEISKADYTISKTDKTITLATEFLDTLSVGKHTILIAFMGGDAKCNFTVLARGEEPSMTEGESLSSNEAVNGDENINIDSQKDKETIKNKNNKITIIIVIVTSFIALSLSGIAVYLLVRNNKTKKQADNENKIE